MFKSALSQIDSPKLLLLFSAIAGLIVSACGGGRGASCQRDSDCPTGQQCEAGAHVCARPNAGNVAEAPTIAVTTLVEAMVGQPYQLVLAIQGGAPPFLWSIASRDERLNWVQIDDHTGRLSGMPSQVVQPGAPLTLQVADSEGHHARKTLPLAVRMCLDGETVGCSMSALSACFLGTRVCSSGALGNCGVGSLSTDVTKCGEGCLPCDARSNGCIAGTCHCGTGIACNGAANTCCGLADGGSICANTRSDPNFCNGCGVSCDTDRGSHTRRGCDGGACEYPCVAGWGRCPANSRSCNTDFTNPDTCGACTNRCPRPGGAPDGGYATCALGGQCGVTCNTGFHLCDQNRNCFSRTDPMHCGPTCESCRAPQGGRATCTSDQCRQVCDDARQRVCPDNTCQSNDIAHCGPSCVACPSPVGGQATCDGTSCGGICPNPALPNLCAGACVNLAIDINNCGTCGNQCPAPPAGAHATCWSGQCGYACDNPSYVFCGSECRAQDVDHCGPSCRSCPQGPLHSSRYCRSDGTCAWVCDSGYIECDGACRTSCR